MCQVLFLSVFLYFILIFAGILSVSRKIPTFPDIISLFIYSMIQFLNNTIFKSISEVADSTKTDVYVIGGFVRDQFLNRASKDIDILVIGDGINFAKLVKKHVRQNVSFSVFKNYGTAQLKFKDLEVEFVGARKESYSSDSRNPVVESGTLNDDQLRRDFTINTLAISLNKENYGALLDPFGGLLDLQNKCIKTPLEPGQTFSDDPLRMMRCIRFATQLNFTIEAQTLQALHDYRDRIKIISGERVLDELNKIMLSPKPSIGFKLLSNSGLLMYILPELEAMKGVETKDGIGHKDNFYHTLQVLDNLCTVSDDLYLRWSAVFHDIAKPITKQFDPKNGWTFHNHNYVGSKMLPRIFRRLKMPMNDKLTYVQKIVNLHMRPIVLSQETVTDSAIRRLLFEAGDDIEDLMNLCEADITSKNEAKVKRHLANFRMVRKKLEEIEAQDHVRNFQPPVSGELIMETFGLGPSREIGSIKSAIKEAILDGIIPNDFDAAFQFMLQKGDELGLKRVK